MRNRNYDVSVFNSKIVFCISMAKSKICDLLFCHSAEINLDLVQKSTSRKYVKGVLRKYVKGVLRKYVKGVLRKKLCNGGFGFRGNNFCLNLTINKNYNNFYQNKSKIKNNSGDQFST